MHVLSFRITKDDAEEEMEQNMNYVDSLLGNLRNMAIDIGNEIDIQNKQMDNIAEKVREGRSPSDGLPPQQSLWAFQWTGWGWGNCTGAWWRRASHLIQILPLKHSFRLPLQKRPWNKPNACIHG